MEPTSPERAARNRPRSVKYSLALQQPTIQKLEAVWFELRQKRPQLKRWEVVDVVLEAALTDPDYILELLQERDLLTGGQ